MLHLNLMKYTNNTLMKEPYILSDDFEVSESLKIHAGLRYSSFQHSGYISFRDYLKNDLTGSDDNYNILSQDYHLDIN